MIAPDGGHSTVVMTDNRIMTGSAASPLRHALQAPFTRRAWAELGYTLVTVPLACAAVAFFVPMLENGIFWALSTPVMRKFAAASRLLAHELLGEDVPPPPPVRNVDRVKVRTRDRIGRGHV